MLCAVFVGHLSHSRDLLQLIYVRRRASSIVRRALTISHIRLLLENYQATYYHFGFEASLGKEEYKL